MSLTHRPRPQPTLSLSTWAQTLRQSQQSVVTSRRPPSMSQRHSRRLSAPFQTSASTWTLMCPWRHTTRSCFDIQCQLQSVQWSLPRHAVVSLVTSLVLTKLDYCNSLSVGLPAKLLNRLQAVINTAARLICDARKADHITPVLKDLHWLRIQGRIQYKLYVLAFKCHYWYINYRQV